MGTRIISGIIGIALATIVIQMGGAVFSAFVLILAIIGWREYNSAFKNMNIALEQTCGALTIFALWAVATQSRAEYLFPIALLGILAVFSKTVFCHRTFSVQQACYTVAGLVYVGFTFVHLRLLRAFGAGVMVNSPVGPMELGCGLIWITLIGTWSSDTFAYFSGYFFGKHKLCSAVSPKKTIEGFIGGVLGTVATVTAVGVSIGFPAHCMAILGLLLALAATLGDLVESAIKRYTGIKDSGNLIPGHGGVLDRFDSVMFTAPFVYYYMKIFLASM